MTDLPHVPVGATWHCADLHLHTPGVPSFALPAGTDIQDAAHRARLVNEYVARLSSAGVQIAAITDYQGIRQPWFQLISDRGAEAGITILPGAEMSIGPGAGRGVHLLLICGPATDPARIAEVIRHQGANSDRLYPDEVRGGHHDLTLRGSLQDALKAVRDKLGCVVIAAHAMEANGLIKALGAQQAAELVRDGLIDAIDHCESARGRLESTCVLRPEQLASLCCTESSDPKAMEQIGAKTLSDGRRRLTWIKLSTVEADALRLALHDPQTRVLTRPPEPVRHPRVLAMQVQGGFLDGLELGFSDDLTTLIGGRGAGKSAILETLRYGLAGEPYTDQSERLSLVRHALGSGGRVRLVIERPGPQHAQRYEVARVLEQRPRVTNLENGTALDVPPLELFGSGCSPVILLQREIQAVAQDDSFRRRLLDEIIGDEARKADTAVQRTIDELRRNGRAIDELERQVDKRDDYREHLHRLDSEIGYYAQQGLAEKLSRHSMVGADRSRIETAMSRIGDALRAQYEYTELLRENLAAAAASLSAAESEHAAVLTDLASSVSTTRDRLVRGTDTPHADLRDLQARVAAARTRWPALVAPLEQDLRAIQRESGAQPLDAERYVTMVAERTALLPIIDAMARLEAEYARLQSERAALLRRLQDERHQGFSLRRQAADSVNRALDGRLRMEVSYLGDTEDFGQRLSAVVRGSGLSSDAVLAIAGSSGADGSEIAQSVRQGEAEVARHFGITEAMARRLAQWLAADPKRMRQLEVLAPHDRVAIALDVGGAPRDLALLSSGQRATALLLLLFAQGSRPLILDQPEDDLDNRFVYEDVVGLLRAEKGVSYPSRRRQIIVATHNANIPVNGDAELVLSLADEGGHCAVLARASIDDAAVRSEIRAVLEGGAEAFRRRAEKYGGLDDAR